MKWERGHQSSDVDDMRGTPARGGGGGTALRLGGGGSIVALLIYIAIRALGGDASMPSPSSSYQQGPTEPQPGGAPPDPATDPDREMVEFVNFVIDDIQDTFTEIFKRAGKSYRRSRLGIFKDAVDTGCGTSSSAVGPFYCPPDQKAYIDLSFYRELRERFGAAGDFAQAYVLAHEIGHHVQNLLGIEQQARRRGGDENEMSVRMELQADCFAGVWAHSTDKRKLLEAGDVEEALNAAAAIGDDRLQKKAGVQVNAETWTHGSSDQRVRWFKRGLENGELGACDTFSAERL